MTEDEKQLLAELREKHGKIKAYRVDDQLIVIRRPKSEMVRAVQRAQEKNANQYAVGKDLILSVAVHPDRDTVKALLDGAPLALDEIIAGAQLLAKGGVEELGEE